VKIKKKKLVHDGFFKLYVADTTDGPREIVEATDSVNILLYDPLIRRILLVVQPRASMVREDNPTGQIVETIAGRFDVDLSAKELIVKEASEEAGIKLSVDQVEMLNNGVPMAVSAGMTTERAYLAIARVKIESLESLDDGKEFGAPDEGEHIERIFYDFDQLHDIVWQDVRAYALVQYLMRMLQAEGIAEFIDGKINSR